MPENPVDIYVVGTGIVGYNQLTREAISALEESERVYWAGTQDLVLDHIQTEYGVDEVVDVNEEYQEGRDRMVTYERMSDAVIEGAEELDSPVAFASHGHPFVFSVPSRLVVEKAAERGLNVESQPGISSLACIFADFNIDPMDGFQMFEASDMLVREWEPNPEVPAMIWQIGAVETLLYSDDWSTPERYTRFREYLEQFYPSDHEVELLQAATFPVADSDRFTVELGEFESMHETIDRGLYILYVPPVEERPIQNEELYEQFQSEEHIQQFSRQPQ